jgi:hypothetical protein
VIGELFVVAAAVIVVATTIAIATSPQEERAEGPGSPGPQVPASGTCAAAEIEVRVLGPVVVVRGGATLKLPPRLVEAAAYLATHPEGVTESEIRTALWRDQPSTGGALRNLLWQLRRQLGATACGEPAVAFADADGRYRLHPGVRCDLDDLFRSDDEVGLRSVRGRVFEAPKGFEWAYAEGLVAWAEERIVDLCERNAAVRDADCDPTRLLRIASAGLASVPNDERLHRLVFRAHGASGDRAALERAMTRLLAAVEASDPAALEPRTFELYKSLLPRPTRAA